MHFGVAGAWYLPAMVASASALPVPAAGVGAPSASRTRTPTLRLERRCWGAGEPVVVGIDEVGRGAWAGPVTVAARVRGWAVAIGVGHASYEECDALGMTAALRAAGRRALGQLAALGYEPDRIILDGNYDYLALGARVTTVVRGDSTSLSVAAASCVAKVTRDALMREEAEHYPAYDFESNVGYPAPIHKSALAWYGPSAIHRRSWIFMDGLCWRGVPPAPGRLF